MINLIKNILRINKKSNQPLGVKDYIDSFLKSTEYLTFIQVGSNNGKNNDPLYPFIINQKLRGILIEPIHYLFLELKANHINRKNLFFENAALDSETGVRPIYRLKKADHKGLPEWYEQLASFNKEVILSHKEQIPGLEELLIEDVVECITFDSLIQKYSISGVDIIHIDTEGYDYEILRLIPYEKLNPKLIIFEHKHLSSIDEEKSNKLLENYGYKLVRLDVDTIAIK